MPAKIVDRLGKCYSGAVYDAMREIGLEGQVLPHQIAPLERGVTLAGPVFTMEGRRQEDATADDSLLSWTEFLSEAEPGSVVVCQPNDSTLAHMGELSAEVLHRRGIIGFVVDGGCRDTEFIANLGFPVFARYLTPADIVGRWVVESMRSPIQIGGVTVNSEDYVIADRDGIVVVPHSKAEDVVTRAEELMMTESNLRRELRSGRDPREAYLEYRVF